MIRGEKLMITMRNLAKLIKILLAKRKKAAVYVSEAPRGDLGYWIPSSILATYDCTLEDLHYG